MSEEEKPKALELSNVAPDQAETTGVPPPESPAVPGAWWLTLWRWTRDYFTIEKPTASTALVPLCFLSMALFTRWIRTNFIFDEQEALLANPYVRSVTDPASKLTWGDAFHRDFWGLLPDRSIGSYRPLPDLVWRALWGLGAREQSPFLHHWVNVLLHGLNGALMVVFAYKLTKDRLSAWLTGAAFTAAAILTEAVSGVVGLADVLGALGAILALLSLWLPLWAMPAGVFGATLIGLYSKESALAVVPLVPFAALLLSQHTHPKEPLRAVRMLGALVGTLSAFLLYVEARRRMFPVATPPELGTSLYPDREPIVQMLLAFRDWSHHPKQAKELFDALLRWYAQPVLPKDPLNNPLVLAPTKALRVGGALRVYFRGLVQVTFPWTLSGDYSAPQEPVPATPWFPESVLGALGMALPWVLAPLLGVLAYLRWRKQETVRPKARVAWLAFVALAAMWVAMGRLVLLFGNAVFPKIHGYWLTLGLGVVCAAAFLVVPPLSAWLVLRKRAAPVGEPSYDASTDVRPLIGVACVWVVVSYFPVSNIPILLPTVRAERFWYFPVIGTSVLIGLAFAKIIRVSRERGWRWVGVGFVTAYFLFQCFAARRHANDYTDDLTFWDATRKSVPRSAKAHLNYSVMQGARGNLEERRRANVVALELAPEWPMANIYLGDTLCRMHRPYEAWPYYKRGFELAPNDPNLISLALQCLWDEKALGGNVQSELEEMGPKFPASWLDFLQSDTIKNGATNGGVDPKYRPRGYNEGPKNE